MNRRSLILGAGLAAVSSRLFGKQDTVGGLQRAYVTQPQLVRQQCPEWCWAASSSMIFAAHGHPVDQTKIVERIFGPPPVGFPPACVASGPTSTISRVLSEQWLDDSGKTFQPRITAGYDPSNGIVAITNAFIINELANDRPILYCNTHHAMVIVDFNYVTGPGGVIVPQQVGVLDPWPTSPPYHALTVPEMYGVTMAPGGQMTYLAAVQI
jgi:hypothetical protein